MSSKLTGSKEQDFQQLHKKATLFVQQLKHKFTEDTIDKKEFEAFINLTDDSILNENEVAYLLYPMGTPTAEPSFKKSLDLVRTALLKKLVYKGVPQEVLDECRPNDINPPFFNQMVRFETMLNKIWY